MRRYVNKLRSGELWGGLVEIAIYAVLSNQAVVVYEVDEKRREYRVQTKVNVHEGLRGQRCVVYNGRDHFDELEVKERVVIQDVSCMEIDGVEEVVDVDGKEEEEVVAREREVEEVKKE